MRDKCRAFLEWLRRPRHLLHHRPYEIHFDQASFVVTDPKGCTAVHPWSDIIRIGYRTTELLLSPWDHALEFHNRDGTRVFVSLEWPGALSLADHVETFPDTRLGPLGSLSNCTTNKSVVIWPANEAGRSMDDFMGALPAKASVRGERMFARILVQLALAACLGLLLFHLGIRYLNRTSLMPPEPIPHWRALPVLFAAVGLIRHHCRLDTNPSVRLGASLAWTSAALLGVLLYFL